MKTILHYRNSKIIHIAFISILTFLLIIPFYKKAYHIDDPLFIWTVQHILENPIDFFGFSVNWYDYSMPMSQVMQNPPFFCYFLALIQTFFDSSETTLHLVLIIPAILSNIGTYLLASKYSKRPIFAAVFSLLTPVFLISSTTLMCDVLMLAFWNWAIIFWISGFNNDNSIKLIISVLLISLCFLTKYFGISLVPLLIVYSYFAKKKVSYKFLFFLLPIAVIILYQIVTFRLYHENLFLNAANYALDFGDFANETIYKNIFIGIAYMGGCFATLLFFIPLIMKRKSIVFYIFIYVFIVIVSILFLKRLNFFLVSNVDGPKMLYILELSLFTIIGVIIVHLSVVDFWQSKSSFSLLLLLWIIGTLVFSIIINWCTNGRSFLPMLPALAIIISRKISKIDQLTRATQIWCIALSFILSAVLSILVTISDYNLANINRQVAHDIVREYKNATRTIWFQGHWGFQYYMEEYGAKSVDIPSMLIAPNDILIIPLNNTSTRFIRARELHFIKKIEKKSLLWISTMNVRSGAGFYSSLTGPLPFVFGNIHPEEYLVYTTNCPIRFIAVGR